MTDATCRAPGCDRPRKQRKHGLSSFCSMHLQRMARTGDPLGVTCVSCRGVFLYEGKERAPALCDSCFALRDAADPRWVEKRETEGWRRRAKLGDRAAQRAMRERWPVRACEGCTRRFRPRTSLHRFHSEACCLAVRVRRRRARARGLLACRGCGVPFVPRHGCQRFHSDPCGRDHYNRSRRAYRPKRKLP